MKYDLNRGIPIITAHCDRVILYHTYFIWEKTGDVYLYSEAPENILLLIWGACWPYRNVRDRTLSKVVGFDFIKAFKRSYKWHKR